MRHYDGPFTHLRVEQWITWNVKNYETYGYGLWGLVLRKSGELVGDCGLTWQRVGYSPDRELEAGWHVRRDLWNRGLATEAALVCRDYAADILRLRHLIALTRPGNLASQAVARKIGMTFEREDVLDGDLRHVFGLEINGAAEGRKP
jgi:RimJ/RimL family protein N-acetyltransferase